MRLPFLQMESDLLAHSAPQVAALAGCSTAQAIGHIALLRAWAVSQGGDNAAPDGWARGEDAADAVEAAAQWSGEPGRFLRALKVARLVVVEADGVRVLGMEPYQTAWAKNAKAKARMANVRARSVNVRGTSSEQVSVADERSAKFGCQTQTQTQTQKEEPFPVAVAPDAVKVLVAQAQLLPEAVAEKPESPGTAPAALQALWNRLAVPRGLQHWKSMSRARLGASRAALAAVPDLAQWEAWLTYELSRPWNLGENDRGWRADVNWLLAAKRRDSVADFNPAAVPVVENRDRPRLGPKPATTPAVLTGDRPRL